MQNRHRPARGSARSAAMASSTAPGDAAAPCLLRGVPCPMRSPHRHCRKSKPAVILTYKHQHFNGVVHYHRTSLLTLHGADGRFGVHRVPSDGLQWPHVGAGPRLALLRTKNIVAARQENDAASAQLCSGAGQETTDRTQNTEYSMSTYNSFFFFFQF